MAERGLLETAEAEAMLADWLERRERPGVIFLSPVLVDVAARARQKTDVKVGAGEVEVVLECVERPERAYFRRTSLRASRNPPAVWIS
jgi:hypothetical protein